MRQREFVTFVGVLRAQGEDHATAALDQWIADFVQRLRELGWIGARTMRSHRARAARTLVG